MRDPARAVEAVVKRSEGAKKDVELERLRMALRDNILTPAVKANGYGGVDSARLDQAIEQIGQTYQFKDKPMAVGAFDNSFLPPASDRRVSESPTEYRLRGLGREHRRTHRRGDVVRELHDRFVFDVFAEGDFRNRRPAAAAAARYPRRSIRAEHGAAAPP